MESLGASLDQLAANFDWISNFNHSYDLNALLHSNDSPSPLQSVNLEIAIDNMEYISGKIQPVLDLLGDAVVSLEAHMSRVRSFQRDYQVMLSPIRRVPVEVLTEILSYTWTVADNTEKGHVSGFNVFLGREGPWLLGQVCRRWRGVVSTLCPWLWTTMSISIPCRNGMRCRNPKYAVKMLRHALECTRGRLLDFRFEVHSPRSAKDCEIVGRCFNLMLGQSVRWRRAELKIPPSLLRSLSRICGKIDFLTDVYLQCERQTDYQPVPITAFEIAPRLKNIHLKGIHPEVEILFPTANLVSFCDGRFFLGDQFNPVYTRIVKSSPKLLSLTYHNYTISSWHPTFPLPPSRVTSQSIQTLSVSSADFLRTIDVPALREVVLIAPNEGDDVMCLPSDIITALSELIQHSHCSLTRLSVINVTVNGNKLPSVLRLTPCLEQLFVKFHQWTRNNGPGMKVLVESLAETVTRNERVRHSIIPSLTSLGIELKGIVHTHNSLVDAKLVAMIVSRHLSGGLKKLVLHLHGNYWSHNMSLYNRMELQSLREKGLLLNFAMDGQVL